MSSKGRMQRIKSKGKRRRFLLDGQGARRRKEGHRRNSPRHKRSFQDINDRNSNHGGE